MGIQQASLIASTLASGAVVPIIGPWRLYIYATNSTGRARITYHTDGTISRTIDGPVVIGTVGGSRWYNPTTVGIGTTHWIRATATDVVNSAPNAGSGVGTWLQLTSDRFWEVNLNDFVGGGSSQTRFVRLLFEIATDSGGSNIVARSTDNVLLGEYYTY